MIKRLLPLAFLLLSSHYIYADQPLLLEYNDFSGGMDSQHLAEKLNNNQIRENINFRTDFNFGLSRRDGFKNETMGCSSFTAANGLWSFTDTSNNEWLIRLDSAGFLGATNRQATSPCLTTAVSTGPLSVATPTDADVGLGKIWFVNKVDGLMSWDGSTFAFYPTAPRASRVAIYRNRVILADVSNEQSSLRMSGELNGSDFSNDARFSTSPVSIPIGGVNDGRKVYDFFPGLGEGIVFKAGYQGGMYRLLGNDQRDFRVEQITPEIGTIFPNTISQKGPTTLFLSNRGLDSYTPPYSFNLVGNPIQNLLEPLARLTSLAKSLTVGSVADWTAGASSPTMYISTYIFTGDIAPNNHTFTDTDEVSWSLGYASNTASFLSTTTTAGALVFISTAQTIVNNASFEIVGAGSTSPANWNLFSNGGSAVYSRVNAGSFGALPAIDGSFVIDLLASVGSAGIPVVILSTRLAVSVIDANTGNVITSVTLQNSDFPGTSAMTIRTLDTSSFVGRKAFIQVSASIYPQTDGSIAQGTMTSLVPIYLSTALSFYAGAKSGSFGAPKNFTSQLDMDFFVPATRPAQQLKAWYTSQTFDTRISSPNYDPFRASLNQISVASATVTFGIQTSSADNDCCWNAPINVSTTTPTISNAKNRYIRYVSTFATNNSSTESAVVVVDSITLGSWATGYFRTSANDVGADITSWGLFTAVQDLGDDGSIVYELQAQNNPTFVESDWVTTSLNTIPVIPTRRYVFARMTFDTNSSTTIPFVDNITFNWNIGAGNPVPVAATYREGYYLYYSTSITNITKNDRIAVVNRNGVLDQFKGSTISAVTIFNNTLEMGDALPTGNIFSMDKSTDGTDAGAPVHSSIVFKRLDGNNNPDSQKIWDGMYITISRQDISISQIFKVEYAVDGSTNFQRASNIEISTGVSIASLRSDIPQDQERQGQYLDIKFTELTENTLPYTLNRLRVYGTILEVE